MKSDRFLLATIASSWLLLCAAITLIITGRGITSGSLVVFGILHFSPLLLNPLSRVMLLFRRSPFVLMKKRHRVWLHLNPWLSVGQPGLRDITHFWDALIHTLSTGLASPGRSLILSSHLLSSRRLARLLRHFPPEHYQYRILGRPLGRAERSGLQLETLLKEWRWYSPSVHCGVLVIRKKDKRH